MRRWSCDVCSATVPFEASRCDVCGSALGYIPEAIALRSLVTVDDVTYHCPGDDTARWRCLNAAYGCNWMLTAEGGNVWCRSCRLTRGRPDDRRVDAITAWASAEASKRRLVHQLDVLGLAVEALGPDQSDGLAFDLVHLDDGSATTGYASGVVTLDLAETDTSHRESLRVQLGEGLRTVMGHLRHEAGHHYFRRLVSQSDDLVEFRASFGDETQPYAEALRSHYASPATWDPHRFITAYATAHPLEDWAETFAHYLHIVDAAESAATHGINPDSYRAHDFDGLLSYWRTLVPAVNQIAAALGAAELYPFATSGDVVDKLAFVHRQVTKHSQRRDFYGLDR